MEDNKRGTRKRIVRKAGEGRSEKVDFSTSRSFDSGERPRRAYTPRGEGRPYGEGRSHGESRPYGERKPHGGEGRPYGESRGPREERPYGERKPRSGEGRPYGESRGPRSGYGKPGGCYGKPGAARKPYAKRSGASEGMSAMLSRKPQVSGRDWSDDDTVKAPIQEVVRLNKYIANSGVCSRREADTLIQSGVVTVNGEVVTELGTKVNVLTDDIRFNGERLKGEDKMYILMNKPKGYVTTASDPHAEKTVMDLLKGCPTRVFPVGRLDKNTTGVLMFTNDGEMAERLTHPSYNKKKIYQVVLDHPLTEEDKEKV